MSFEFNQFFLKFLAYHHVSNRFRTFMLDNESRRVEAGWMLEESKIAGRSEPVLGEPDVSCSFASGLSVWDYIDEHRKSSSTFYNFFYSARDQEPVSYFIRSFFSTLLSIFSTYVFKSNNALSSYLSPVSYFCISDSNVIQFAQYCYY